MSRKKQIINKFSSFKFDNEYGQNKILILSYTNKAKQTKIVNKIASRYNNLNSLNSKKIMKIQKINLDFDFNELEDIVNNCIDVNVTLDDGRTYIVQLITQNNLLLSIKENQVNFDFIAPIAPSISVKELTMETIEAPIKYYVKEDDGYWLKFCHMGTEIDNKILNVLTDRWFAKNK